MWIYTRSTRQYTFIAGSTSFSLGTSQYPPRGTAATSSTPSTRLLAGTAVDGSGNLLLWGGTVYNDLWSFSLNTLLWKFVAGTTFTGLSPNYSYGKGVPFSGALNAIGTREAPLW